MPAPPPTSSPPTASSRSAIPVPWFRQSSHQQSELQLRHGRRAATSSCASTARRSDEVGARDPGGHRGRARSLFDDDKLALFGVSVDPVGPVRDARPKQILPGIRHFWDFDGTVGRLYGALPRNVLPGGGPVPIRRFWMVLNPTLRVRAIFPFEEDGSDRDEVMAYLPGPAARRRSSPASRSRRRSSSFRMCSSPSSAAT